MVASIQIPTNTKLDYPCLVLKIQFKEIRKLFTYSSVGVVRALDKVTFNVCRGKQNSSKRPPSIGFYVKVKGQVSSFLQLSSRFNWRMNQKGCVANVWTRLFFLRKIDLVVFIAHGRVFLRTTKGSSYSISWMMRWVL